MKQPLSKKAIQISNKRRSGENSPWIFVAFANEPKEFVLEGCFSAKTMRFTPAEAKRLRDALTYCAEQLSDD